LQNSGRPDIRKTRRKLSVLLLAASTAILAGGFFYYRSYRAALLEDTETLLRGVTSFKTDQLLDWRRDRLQRAASLLDTPVLSVPLNKLAADPKDRETADLLRRRLESFLRNNPYKSAVLATPDGRMLVMAGSPPNRLCPDALELLKRAPRSPEMSDLHAQPDTGTSYGIHVAGLAGTAPGGARLFLILGIDPAHHLYPLVQKWPGPSRTAETLLVRREGDQILFLNELRHAKGTALKLRLPLSPELPAAMAATGRQGLFRGVDYRGKDVFAYLSQLPEFGWAMVTKVDAGEILADSDRTSALLLLLVITLLAASAAGTFLFLRLQEESYSRVIATTDAKLKETEQIFREFMEHSPIYVFFKDENLRSLNLSRNFEKMLGKPLRELLGKNMFELFPSDLAKSMVEDDKRVVAGDGEVTVEEELNGRHYVTTKFPIRIEGKPAYLAGYTIDMTERKLAEKERIAHIRFLEHMDKVNKAMQNAADLEKMMENILNTVLKVFDCDRAWLFYPCDPDSPHFRVPMEVTKPEYPGAKVLNVDIPMPPDMADDLREALRCAAPVTYTAGTPKPVNRVSAEQFGVRSQMFTAVYPKLGKPWVFGIHQCSYARVWTAEETRLFQEITRRLTDALTSLLSIRDLRESEQELKEAQRLARIGNWTLDLVSNNLSWSDEIYRIFELDKEKFGASYEAFLDAIHPEDRERVNQAYTDSVKERTQYDITHRLLMKDGRIKHVRECCESAYSPEGKPLRSTGTVQDITEQRLAQENLREAEERLRTLMNSMPDIVCFKDGEGRWLEANNFDLKLFQLENVPYKGKKDSELAPFSAFYHDAFMTCEASDEKAWLASGFSRGEERIPRPDGGEYVFDIIKVPLFTPEGKRKGLTVVGRDITERKLAELQLEKLNKDLRDKNQEMENFLYITTHDLRSPLVNIQGFGQNLQHYQAELGRLMQKLTGMPPEDEARLKELAAVKVPEALDFVLNSSRKMDALITALLKVSRAGRVEMKPEKLEMEELMTKVLDAMRFQLNEAGADIKTGALPPCHADPGAVNQLFANLLDNAVKYRDRARSLTIELSGEVKGDMAVYRVADNGPGIPEGDLHKIWNVFYRHERDQQKKGEGIGLPMVRRLVEKNGGNIRAESVEGKGTVFYVELPAAQGGTDEQR